MEKVINGLVINVKDYKENDKQLTILSREQGKIIAVCKGVKKAYSKFKPFACPFCFAEFTLNGEYTNVVTSVNAYDTFFNLSSDIKKFYSAMCILNLLNKTQEQNLNHQNVFLHTITAIKNICYKENQELHSLCIFLVQYLSEMGYTLNTHKCFNCGCDLSSHKYLNPYDGGFYCTNCSTPYSENLIEKEAIFIDRIQESNKPPALEINEYKHLLKCFGNTIYCLTAIKIDINYLL